jgi:hypothetical protein
VAERRRRGKFRQSSDLLSRSSLEVGAEQERPACLHFQSRGQVGNGGTRAAEKNEPADTGADGLLDLGLFRLE